MRVRRKTERSDNQREAAVRPPPFRLQATWRSATAPSLYHLESISVVLRKALWAWLVWVQLRVGEGPSEGDGVCALLQRWQQHPNSISYRFVFTCWSSGRTPEDIIIWESNPEERSTCAVLLFRNRNTLSVNGDEDSAAPQKLIDLVVD